MEKAGVGLLMVVLLVGFVSAYGVAAPYWEGHPLKIAPGDTKTVSITLQNVGEGDETVSVELKEGSHIASIREGIYEVPAGTIDTEILVTVNVPEEATFEQLEKVTISTTEVRSGDTGGVALGVGFETTFDVLVSDIAKTGGGGVSTTLIIVILVVLALIVLAVVLSKKKKPGKKKRK